jgi:hypothetical protein
LHGLDGKRRVIDVVLGDVRVPDIDAARHGQS